MATTETTPAPAPSFPFPPKLHRTPWGDTVAFAKDPVGFIGRLTAQGPLARMDLVGQKAIMVSEPELVREVLLTRAGELEKFKALPRIELLLGKGLFTTEGEVHKQHRRMVMPAFHRGAIGHYASLIVELTRALRDSWKDGEEVLLPPVMSRLTLDMMVQSLYGTQLGPGLQRIQDAMGILGKHFAISTPTWLDRILLRLPLRSTKETMAAVAEMDAVLAEVLAKRQASTQPENDLLQMLMDARDEQGQPLSPKELRDEAMTLLLAGHDTMAVALTWSLGLLVNHPEIQAAFQAELKNVLGDRLPTWEDYPKLGFSERIFAEAMRLFPPGWILARTPKDTFKFAGHEVKKGTLLVTSAFWAHRDERVWADPEKFDPERFTPAAKEARKPFTYLPFSAGPRSCIGENFAWMQGVLILATFCQKWRFEAAEGGRLELKPVARLLLSPEKAPKVNVRAA